MEKKTVSATISLLREADFEDQIWQALIKESKLGDNYNPYFVERTSEYNEEMRMNTYTLVWYEAENPTLPEGVDEKSVVDIKLASCVGPHNPTQHRDGKEPWCYICGLTRDYRKPKSMFPGEQLR